MSDKIMDKPSIDLLVKELSGVAEWYTLGALLRITETEIRVIEQDHHDTARRRMAMLSKWMEKDLNTSWQKIITALEEMSQATLANHLKEKYIQGASCLTPDYEETKEIKIDRNEDVVARNLEDVEERYLKLIVATESALKKVDPSPEELGRFSAYYTRVKVTTVAELFDCLEHHCFLDYTLLERIISFFLKNQAQSVVNDFETYIQHLKMFKSSTTIREFMESIEKAQKSLTTANGGIKTCTVVLRLVGGWLEKTMTDLDKLLKELFQDKRSVLSHIQIVRGSVIVTYFAPQSEIELLKSLAMESISLMSEVGVCGLHVADTVIFDTQSVPFVDFRISLITSIANKDTKLLRFLFEIRTSPDTTMSRLSVLYLATSLGNNEAVDLLLQAGANPNLYYTNKRYVPLIMAIERRNSYVADLLLKANANPNHQFENGSTPLYLASELGCTDIVRLLVKANANPNLQTDDGGTALHIASANGNSDVVKVLLDVAEPNCQTNKGETPLFLACSSGHSAVVSMLLEAKADPNLQRSDKTTPLLMASHLGFANIVGILLDANVDPNHQSDNCISPLMSACLNRNPETVQLLLQRGADPKLQHSPGNITALMCACQSGCLESVELLLKYGADISVASSEGPTAIDIAASAGHKDIVQTLKARQSSSTETVDDKAVSLVSKAMENMFVTISEALISAQISTPRSPHVAHTEHSSSSQLEERASPRSPSSSSRHLSLNPPSPHVHVAHTEDSSSSQLEERTSLRSPSSSSRHLSLNPPSPHVHVAHTEHSSSSQLEERTTPSALEGSKSSNMQQESF